MKRPVFGDRLKNHFAGKNNPRKYGTFVEVIRRKGKMNPGTFYRCTDEKEDFWECPVDCFDNQNETQNK